MKSLKKGGFLVSKIHQVSSRIFNKKLKQYDIDEINSAQGKILFVLWENDNIPITELSKKTMLGKSTLTSMLDRLEKSGYIKRNFDKNDRRKIIINRTEKDRSMQKTYIKISKEMSDVFYKNFTEKEIIDFEKKLEKILFNISKI